MNVGNFFKKILGIPTGYVHHIKGKDIWITDNKDLKRSKVIYSVRYGRFRVINQKRKRRIKNDRQN